jgi:hypothetical protein
MQRLSSANSPGKQPFEEGTSDNEGLVFIIVIPEEAIDIHWLLIIIEPIGHD